MKSCICEAHGWYNLNKWKHKPANAKLINESKREDF